MDALIQVMTIQDYDEVHTLWQESDGIELGEVNSKDDITRFLERNPGLSFVARDNGQLVGAVLCGHDGMTIDDYGEWLHKRAVDRDVTILDGMGFAPGISNITLGEGIASRVPAGCY